MKHPSLVYARFEIWAKEKNHDSIIEELKEMYKGNPDIRKNNKKNTIIFHRLTNRVIYNLQNLKKIKGVIKVLYFNETKNPS